MQEHSPVVGLPDQALRVARYRASGEWTDERLGDIVRRRVEEEPGRVIVVDGPNRVSRSALFDDARRLGSALGGAGLAPGAVIAFQLPNWAEACVINLAAALFGFTINPLLPIYREAELELMLRETGASVLFIPDRFRGVDYPALIAGIAPRLPALARIVVVRSSGAEDSYERLLRSGRHDAPMSDIDPNARKMILYTSGGTGKPKGVQHTHNTLHALIRMSEAFWDLHDDDVMLVPSPVGHIGGSIYAFEFPWMVGLTAVLMDRWEPDRAIDLIETHRVSFAAGATPFLADLVTEAERRQTGVPSLRRFLCGGASVSPELIRRAASRFADCLVFRGYGSTEVPLVCPGIRAPDQSSYGAETDGECLAELQFLDDDEIAVRSPRMFVGYLDPADNVGVFTSDGFFRMGDIGRLVDHRYIEITGRKKDIIIRSGENVSPVEIENALLRHQAVQFAAVIGVSDPRTGEAALACVVPRAGLAFTHDDMTTFLRECGLARQKCPEHLCILESMPMNAVGKILKFELRGRSADLMQRATSAKPRVRS